MTSLHAGPEGILPDYWYITELHLLRLILTVIISLFGLLMNKISVLSELCVIIFSLNIIT